MARMNTLSRYVRHRSRRKSALTLATLLAAAAAAAAPVRVVTTIFPLTDWARAVGGDRAEVHQLLPPGVEAHSFAPRPSDLARIESADVFIYLGPDMEPWAQRLLRATSKASRVDVEAARGIERLTACAECEAHDHDHDHDHDGPASAATDPHVWLDPVLAQRMVEAIADGLSRADPEGAETYRRNAAAYNERLKALHGRIESTLRNARHRTLLYGGHFAFGYFARRYGLEHRSPYRGFAPDAAPTPRAVAELIRTLRETGQKVIFHEELIEPRAARVIAEQTGARLLPLHGAHNLSREEAERGDVTYLSIMERNLENLAAGLEAE